MSNMRWITAVLLLSVSLFEGCALSYQLPRGTQYLSNNGGIVTFPDSSFAGTDPDSYWRGDFYSGSPSIVIRLKQQRAFFYKGQKLVGVSSISTGRESTKTHLGKFKIIQKDKEHVSSCFGDYVDELTGAAILKDVDCSVDPLPKGAKFVGARMPYFMRIVGGTGMHQGFLPGYPASHGCIRMPKFMAAAFFESVSVGTPVQISE